MYQDLRRNIFGGCMKQITISEKECTIKIFNPTMATRQRERGIYSLTQGNVRD